MNNSVILDEKEPKEVLTKTGVPLQVLTGHGGGGGEGSNWLHNMEVGTCFLTRNPQDTAGVDLLQFQIVHHAPRSTLLMQSLPNGEVIARRVDHVRFSNRFTWVETLGVAVQTEDEPKEEPKENP